MADKLIAVIFTLCLMLALLLLAILLTPVPDNAGGLPHPFFAGMLIGGDGAARLSVIAVPAILFQCLFLALIVCLCLLGIQPERRDRRLYLMMTAAYAFTLLVWWRMLAAHQHWLTSGESEFFLGFPVATAWQVYGTWLGAIPLILIYSLAFHRYIYNRDDEARFAALLNETRAQQSPAADSER